MKLYEKLKNIYTGQTYTQKYGGYMWMSLLIITTFVSIIGYLMSSGKTHSLKQDWSNNRCNPGVMPFAGIINNTSGKSAMEYTEDNFTYCVENIIGSIAKSFIAPLIFSLSILNKIFSEFPGIFSELLILLQDLMDFIKGLLGMMMVFIENIIVAVERLVGDVRSIISKLYALKSGVRGIVGTVFVAGTGFVNWVFLKIIELILDILLVPLLYSLEMSMGAPATIALGAEEGLNVHNITGFSKLETVGVAEGEAAASIALVTAAQGPIIGGLGNLGAAMVKFALGASFLPDWITTPVGVAMEVVGIAETIVGLGFLVAAVVQLIIFTIIVSVLEWVETNLVVPMNNAASSVL